MQGTFDRKVSRVTLRLFSAFSNFQQPCTLKIAGQRPKLTEIWDSGPLVNIHGVHRTLDLIVFRVSLEVFNLKHLSQKCYWKLSVEPNQTEIWDSEKLV